ncbi:8-amino-7-oxononanoate synthase [Actinopolyspora xinjiangensis]|uniref:8-amino-7-oxononanoate synthase n=1 Tax=Actinopolyspora xinjiangensis TaxID=405564 RepID=A0A1H0QVE5_9ACTN|nr:8-amino-7-oxononanoate synthase [Actinopolyspora xinjiangensis]SDP20716.1 8-amino-7-oxononanoate synthase [Actinopolyspora xinjiangensis]
MAPSTFPTEPPDPRTVFDRLDREAERREADGLTRRPPVRSAEEDVLDLAGNDYLGLTNHRAVTDAAASAARRWGAGAGGSRLVTGTTELHTELEDELAEFCGTESALVFSSGYTANLAVITALSGRNSLLVSDSHNHASLIDGCRLSRAEVRVVAHLDTRAAEAELVRRPHEGLLLTESVFSVDGDTAPLREALRVCRANGAALLIDDAHGLGVLGEGGAGALAAFDMRTAPDVVATVTLSKALGAQGGAVLGPRRVIEHLRQSARTFVFDTGLAPAAAAGALAALRVLWGDPRRCSRVREVAEGLYRELVRRGVPATRPGAAVLGIPVGEANTAVDWAAECLRRGVRVGCFRPPSVPDGSARLRLTARADLPPGRITEVAAVLAASAPEEVLG